MKRLNYLVNGLAALALIVLFSQCTGKAENQTATTSGQASGELTGMKIAYVEIDTLLAQYNFCIDLNEGMVKKSTAGIQPHCQAGTGFADFEQQTAVRVDERKRKE